MSKLDGIEIQVLLNEIGGIVALSTFEERKEFERVLVERAGTKSSKKEWEVVLGKIFSRKLIEKLWAFSMVDTLMDYLEQGEFYLQSFGDVHEAGVVLALSFGESEGVNRKLAEVLDTLEVDNDLIFAQWEVAGLVRLTKGVRAINLTPGETYMTTRGVVERFANVNEKQSKVRLVAQSWHAPRCRYWCKYFGYDVVGGTFVNAFAPNDPQPWVRDGLSWVLKESIAMKVDKRN